VFAKSGDSATEIPDDDREQKRENGDEWCVHNLSSSDGFLGYRVEISGLFPEGAL
jgi:hypothetical protein